MFVVGWDGEGPPDKAEWIRTLREALAGESRSYLIHFHRKMRGWQFDLECREGSGAGDPVVRNAEESVARRVYSLLAETGKPLDPDWTPSAPGPRRGIAGAPPPAAVARPHVVAEARPAAAEAPPTAVTVTVTAAEPPLPPTTVPEALPESVQTTAEAPSPGVTVDDAQPAVLPTTVPETLPESAQTAAEAPSPGVTVDDAQPAVLPTTVPETLPESAQATDEAPALGLPPAPSPVRSRRVWLAGGGLATVGLAAVAGWLSWDRLPSRLTSPPVTLPPATSLPATVPSATASSATPSPTAVPLGTESPESLAAQTRPKAPVAVVARPPRERAGVAGPPARVPVRESTPGPGPAPPDAERADAGPPPTPEPALGPPSSIAPPAAAPTPTPAEEPPAPSTPSPVLLGAVVDRADPTVTHPVPTDQTRPRYPALALERGVEGTVELKVLVDETGAVVEVVVVRASPRGMGFEDAAANWMRKRVYRPATKQGVPVRVWLPIVVEFRRPGRR